MKIVCHQTILRKYHALFVIFEKVAKLGGALWVTGEDHSKLERGSNGAALSVTSHSNCIDARWPDKFVFLTACAFIRSS